MHSLMRISSKSDLMQGSILELDEIMGHDPTEITDEMGRRYRWVRESPTVETFVP